MFGSSLTPKEQVSSPKEGGCKKRSQEDVRNFLES